MRIVIDMQPAQTKSSGYRGVGRYTREIVREFIKLLDKNDEVFLVLNGYFAESCKNIRNEFADILSQDNIKVWNWYPEIPAANNSELCEYDSPNLFREWFFHQFNADVIWSLNFQEGFYEEGVVTSFGETPCNEFLLGTLYDLSPIILGDYKHHDYYLRNWYHKTLEYLTRCNGVLTVSDFSKSKINEILKIDEEKICVAKPAVNFEKFSVLDKNTIKKDDIILYLGGAVFQKNPKALIKAFESLPISIRTKYKLILAGKECGDNKQDLLKIVSKPECLNNIQILGYLTDDEMIELMSKAKIFVFPFLAEGFEIPPIEAIACGTLALTSNVTALPEAIGVKEATFNPFDIEDVKNKIETVINDENYYKELLRREQEHIKTLSWKKSAQNVYDFLKKNVHEKTKANNECSISKIINNFMPVSDNIFYLKKWQNLLKTVNYSVIEIFILTVPVLYLLKLLLVFKE